MSTLAALWKSTWGYLPVLINSPQHLLLPTARAVLAASLLRSSAACLPPGSQTMKGILILPGAKYLL